VLELGAGLPMLLLPAMTAGLLGAAWSPTAGVLIRLFGAAICVLGILAWMAAAEHDGLRQRAGWAFSAYHIAAALILIYGLGVGVLSGALSSGVLIAHLILAGVLARALTATG
jgi:hypothetical protein